jgi:predicted Zn-dependent peptidase
LLSLEDSASRAAALAELELLHGRQISVEESLANVNAVTADEIRAIAREFFRTENMSFAALGALSDLQVTRDQLAV